MEQGVDRATLHLWQLELGHRAALALAFSQFAVSLGVVIKQIKHG